LGLRRALVHPPGNAMGGFTIQNWSALDFDREREPVRDFNAPDLALTQVGNDARLGSKLAAARQLATTAWNTASMKVRFGTG
jgi:hypothetical protein